MQDHLIFAPAADRPLAQGSQDFPGAPCVLPLLYLHTVQHHCREQAALPAHCPVWDIAEFTARFIIRLKSQESIQFPAGPLIQKLAGARQFKHLHRPSGKRLRQAVPAVYQSCNVQAAAAVLQGHLAKEPSALPKPSDRPSHKVHCKSPQGCGRRKGKSGQFHQKPAKPSQKRRHGKDCGNRTVTAISRHPQRRHAKPGCPLQKCQQRRILPYRQDQKQTARPGPGNSRRRCPPRTFPAVQQAFGKDQDQTV